MMFLMEILDEVYCSEPKFCFKDFRYFKLFGSLLASFVETVNFSKVMPDCYHKEADTCVGIEFPPRIGKR